MSTVSTADRSPSDQVDVCVVGAGVAGAVVANRLANRGYDVVVLDAGPRFDPSARQEQLERALRPAHDRSDVWGMGGRRDRYTTELPDRIACDLNSQRVKAIGGTTLHWGGHTPRLHPEDFRTDSEHGIATDWPIDYDTLRPYYARAEAELGVAGAADNPFGPPRETDYPMDAFPPSVTDDLFAAACSEVGITTHSIPQARNTTAYDGRSPCLGYSTCIPVCPSGAKYSADIHIRKAEAAGARVIDSAPVERLIHDHEGVTAARYRVPDGTRYRQRASEFVVACGGIETPRLLLLSDSAAYPNGLANRSGAVGRYFHSHAWVSVTGRLPESLDREPVGVARTESQQFYSRETVGPGSFRILLGKNNPVSPARYAMSGGDRSTAKVTVSGYPWGDELLAEMRRSITENRHLGLSASVETLPRRKNRITLDHGRTDDNGNPVPKIEYDVGEYAIETCSAAIEYLCEIMEATGAEVTGRSDPERQNVGNHHLGTTRMGADPDRSVVDHRCRTHDVPNLWVASSSVFPATGAANPTLTIAALGLRTADYIDAELQATD